MTLENPTAVASRSSVGGRNGEGTTGRHARKAKGSRRRSPLLRLAAVSVVIVAAATTSAILVNALRGPVYGAEAEILYRTEDPSGARAERELATQQVILQGRGVLQPVAAEADLTVEDLQEKLTVDIVGSSDVLRLRVGDRDVAEAVDLTESIADSYVRGWVDDSSDPGSAVLLTPAYPLEDPISPSPVQAGAAGMMVGLLIAGVLVAVRLQREGRYQ